LELLDISLDRLNTKYASKAKLQVSKIQKMLKNIIPEQAASKISHKEKENLCFESRK
jgi:uncharacterized protein YqfB (UPF0267 family)